MLSSIVVEIFKYIVVAIVASIFIVRYYFRLRSWKAGGGNPSLAPGTADKAVLVVAVIAFSVGVFDTVYFSGQLIHALI